MCLILFYTLHSSLLIYLAAITTFWSKRLRFVSKTFPLNASGFFFCCQSLLKSLQRFQNIRLEIIWQRKSSLKLQRYKQTKASKTNSADAINSDNVAKVFEYQFRFHCFKVCRTKCSDPPSRTLSASLIEPIGTSRQNNSQESYNSQSSI